MRTKNVSAEMLALRCAAQRKSVLHSSYLSNIFFCFLRKQDKSTRNFSIRADIFKANQNEIFLFIINDGASMIAAA